MMKKICYILSAAVLLIFVSCGSTKNASDVTHYTIEPLIQEPDVVVEKDEHTDITLHDQYLETDVTINPEKGNSVSPAGDEIKQNEISQQTNEVEKQEKEAEEASTTEQETIPEEISSEVQKEVEQAEEETFEFTKIEDEDAVPEDVPADQLYITEQEDTPAEKEIKSEISETKTEQTEKENKVQTEAAATETKATASEVIPAVTETKPVSSTAPATQTTPAKPAVQNTNSDKTEGQTVSKDEKPAQEVTIEEVASEGEEISQETDLFTSPVVIVPSRSVKIQNNQYLDVVYPGSGWVYIGETQKDPLFTYFGRKIAKGNTTFTLRSKKSGQTVLHFYKNDPLTGEYIDDYLDVTVDTKSARPNTRTEAPSYAEAVPPKPEKKSVVIGPDSQSEEPAAASENKTEKKENTTVKPSVSATVPQSVDVTPAEDSGVKTIIQNTNSKTEKEEKPSRPSVQTNVIPVDTPEENKVSIPSGDLLEAAKKAYGEKQYENALTYIQLYLDSASRKIDEALYVQGQILEAESSVKNVRSAIDSYSIVVNKYPSSKFWKKSNERIIYLKRFYIDIR